MRLWSTFVARLLGTNAGRCGLGAVGAMLVGASLRALLWRLAAFVWWGLAGGALLLLVAQYARLMRNTHVRSFLGTGEDLRRVLARMPTAQRKPWPPIWAFNRHAQFIPWILYNMLITSVAPIAFQKERLRVFGLEDKSKPEGASNRRCIADWVVLNIFPAVASELSLDAPVMIVEPGLTCTAQDIPGSSLLRLAASRGFRVAVVERRGHAAPLEAPRWNLFGDSDDAERVYAEVRRMFPDAPLFWVGISSGSKLIIEGLGKFDERRRKGDEAAPRFVAAACICPGYNLETCFEGFHFPYTSLCLTSVKGIFLLRNESLLREHDKAAYERATRAGHLQELLALAAPFAGYPDGEAYFAAENPVHFAQLVTTPTLILNAEDDPCTVIANAFVKSRWHEGSPTFVDMLKASPCGLLLISPSGSHCAFLDGPLWPFQRVPLAMGGLICASWAERCVLEFFEGYLLEGREQRDE